MKTIKDDPKYLSYADLAIRIGLNLQSGQHLDLQCIGTDPMILFFANLVAESAYRAGAGYVDVLWRDLNLSVLRLQNAPVDSLDFFPQWVADRTLANIKNGGAMMFIIAPEPNLFAGQDAEKIAMVGKARALATRQIGEAQGKGEMNWLGLALPSPAWADLVFPDLPEEDRLDELWQAMIKVLRLNQRDPINAWKNHVNRLLAQRTYLSGKQYRALSFKGPGTDLEVGLVQNHQWSGGIETTMSGIQFTPNLPTEEVFTLPHRKLTEGVVTTTKPLSLRGVLIREFTLTFKRGQVVDIKASNDEEVLRYLLETDENATRLGEVALVPDKSPISQSGLIFYDTLFDENAACHIALGSGMRGSIEDGRRLSDEEFLEAGGNKSAIHVDFMIGSVDVEVEGITLSGAREPLLRDGDWAFTL